MDAEIRRTIETSLDLYRRTAPIEYDELVADRCAAVRAWLAAQPAAWEPVEDGPLPSPFHRVSLSVDDSGNQIIYYNTGRFEGEDIVEFPRGMRLCRRVND